jgi:hypothetical protein
VPAQPAPPQQAEAPLLRNFKVGDEQRYRVELTIRSEVSGQRPRQVGRQTFAEPFTDTMTTTTQWQATRRVTAVNPDESAEIEETLHDFPEFTVSSIQSNKAGQEDAAAKALGAWKVRLRGPMRYRESRNGQVQGLSENAGPVLDDAPPVLTLWLRRALRPSAALPARPPREGDRWQEPRAVRLPPWTGVQGTESGEWLAGPLPERSVVKLIQLHSVQQISGQLPASAAQGSETLPQGEGRFHAESLAALVQAGAPLYGGYGALHSATRSASVELSRVMERVPALNEAPVFRARLTVQVRITLVE